ncbi:hypothetical protein F511_40499 [Dorcoceras hygrometricum]|uniref:Uncharacterized protein n=1 Tax=Dorcoceras hygrometricum TaxID=472368 RepID=A0A2Z7BD52_9LAMI|nr:hypothetical protein F511_40499 [Dorcoceras hygrometricum]
MPPRRGGRGRGKFQDESGGQNEDQRSFPSRGRGRQEEDDVDDLTTRVESMEIVMARFQSMSHQIFNGDESARMRIRGYSTSLAPSSDQFHRETGTSKVGGGRSPNPAHDWKQDSFVSLH